MSHDNNLSQDQRLRPQLRQIEVLSLLYKHLMDANSVTELEQILGQQLKGLFYFCSCQILAESIIRNQIACSPAERKTHNADASDLTPEKPFDLLNCPIKVGDKPLVFDVDAQDQKDARLELGYHFKIDTRQALIATLGARSEIWGYLCFFSDRPNTFARGTIEVADQIASVVSLAISRILAYERFKQEEREKQLLLSFSASIEKVKNRHDLFTVLRERLIKLLSFTDVAISLYNPDRGTFQVFAHQVELDIEQRPEFSHVIAPEYTVNDGIHNAALQSDGPVIVTIEDAMKSPNRHAGTQFIFESGIKEMLCVKLMNSERVLGFLNILSKKRGEFVATNYQILKGITDHLATAIANILSREEILRRDKENDILLAVSTAISASPTLDSMISVIRNRLGTSVYFNDICVSYYNLHSLDYRVLTYEGDLVCKHPGFGFVPETDFPLHDGIHNVLLHSPGVVCFDADELKAMNMPHIDFMLAAGVRICAGVRLVSNNIVIGALVLTSETATGFSQADRSLIHRISQHLATGVSNVKATEKLSEQLEEIQKYKVQLEEENAYLLEEAKEGFSYDDIIGASDAMQKVFQLLTQVSFSNSTVLLQGETGTGKELVARAIHNASARQDKLMVRVNCAAIPAELIESELFGHEKGSFTGALERRIGKFELANHATLFLDEIGELPFEMQVKLLRAIQEREIERVGGKGIIKIDVRIIAATNRNLWDEVQQGRFRSDLFYRLNVFPIMLPPLRERGEDISLLATQFVARFAKNNGKRISRISSNVMKSLLAYPWPGNVRELEHQMERCVLMAKDNVIRDVLLPPSITQIEKASVGIYSKTHEENERDYIVQILNKCNGKIYGPGGAAQLLDLKVSTLNSKIKKLGITREQIILKDDQA